METPPLNLLVPENLPIQEELSAINKEKISLSLKLVLQSFDSNCKNHAILQVEQALTILGTTKMLPGNFYTRNAKKHQEALDYDNYFNINHVISEEPEICLCKSVIIAYQRFLSLCSESNRFTSENIEIQRQGFKTYFQLLSRVFNLSLAQNNEQN